MNESNDQNVSWARAFRDIGVKAISSGQFPLFCAFIIILVFLIRLPSTELTNVSNALIDRISQPSIILFILMLSVGFGYIRLLTTQFKRRINTMQEEIIKLRNQDKPQISEKDKAND